jgi:hypothetical protein
MGLGEGRHRHAHLVGYFKGAILLARMTRRALEPAEFLQVAPETAKPAAK